MEQVCDILKSLDDSSSLDCEYSAEAGETAIVQAKQSLLELWHHLLDCIEKVPVAEVNPIIFSVILWIMKRPEFDLMHLRWDATFTPTCEHHVLIMAYRYRKLLLSTLSYVVRNLNAFAEAYVRANSPRPLIEDISSSSPTSTSSGACSETLAHQDEDITTITTTTTTTTITEPFQQQQKQQKQQQQEGTPLEAIQPLPSPPPPPPQQQQPALEAEECEKKKGNKSEEDEDETKTVEASVPSEGESVDECGPIFKYTPKIPLSPPPPRSKSRKKVVPVQSQNTNTLYGSLPQPFAVFSAKILAFLFFRFPGKHTHTLTYAYTNVV